MDQIRTAEIFIAKHTEDKVHNRSSGFNIRVLYKSRRIKASESKLVYELFERYSILQTN